MIDGICLAGLVTRKQAIPGHFDRVSLILEGHCALGGSKRKIPPDGSFPFHQEESFLFPLGTGMPYWGQAETVICPSAF